MGAPLWRELHFLAALGNQAAFLELLNGIQDQALLDSLLRAAAEAGHSHIVALLIERDADAYSADARGMTPIGLACGRGRMGTVQLLLGEGAHFYNLSSADDRCVAWFLAAVIDSHQQLSADAAQLTAAVEAVRQERDQLKQDKNHLQQDNDSLQGVVAAQQAEIDQLRAELGQQQ